jgi:AcrR family transcriptional regulator
MTPRTAKSQPRTLSTAHARREDVLEAAMPLVARRGYGTPTLEIAKAAGISQAYLFRLFPTKDELFVAVARRGSEITAQTFRAAAAQARAAGEDPLAAMGRAYVEMLLGDRDLLMVQLHAHAACDQPGVRDAMRDCFAELYEIARRDGGADPEQAHAFFANGMLINVAAAMRFDEVEAEWANALAPGA